MCIGDNEAVKCPSLAARPGRANVTALTCVGRYDLAGLSVVLYDMNYRAVLAEVVHNSHICVRHSNSLKAIVIKLLACPVKEREVHKAIDNSPVLVRLTVPGDDISAVKNEAGEKGCRRVKISVAGVLVTVQTVVCTRENVPHKANVVVKRTIVLIKRLVHSLLACKRSLKIFLVAGLVVKEVVKSAPEAVGPPSDVAAVLVHTVLVTAVSKDIARAKSYLCHLFVNLGEGFFCPFFIFFKNLVIGFHIPKAFLCKF